MRDSEKEIMGGTIGGQGEGSRLFETPLDSYNMDKHERRARGRVKRQLEQLEQLDEAGLTGISREDILALNAAQIGVAEATSDVDTPADPGLMDELHNPGEQPPIQG